MCHPQEWRVATLQELQVKSIFSLISECTFRKWGFFRNFSWKSIFRFWKYETFFSPSAGTFSDTFSPMSNQDTKNFLRHTRTQTDFSLASYTKKTRHWKKPRYHRQRKTIFFFPSTKTIFFFFHESLWESKRVIAWESGRVREWESERVREW